MEKQFENLSEIDNRQTYEEVSAYLEQLITSATAEGLLCDPGAENVRIREIGRVARLCGLYENKYVKFKHICVKTPLVLAIEEEMHKRKLNQRETAKLLETNESVISQILSGKRGVSMKIAKLLYKNLGIDPSLILQFA